MLGLRLLQISGQPQTVASYVRLSWCYFLSSCKEIQNAAVFCHTIRVLQTTNQFRRSERISVIVIVVAVAVAVQVAVAVAVAVAIAVAVAVAVVGVVVTCCCYLLLLLLLLLLLSLLLWRSSSLSFSCSPQVEHADIL